MKKDRNWNAGMMPAPGMMVPYPMMGPNPGMGMGPVMMNPTSTMMTSTSSCGCSGNNNNDNTSTSELNRLRQQVNNLERRVSILESKQPTPYTNNYNDSNVQMI